MSTAAQSLSLERIGWMTRLADYGELFKARVTSLIVMTAWCGYYAAAMKSGVSSLSWTLLNAMVGIALVSGGTAALNEVMEHEADGFMRRTQNRPIPAGRMSATHGLIAAVAATLGGTAYLYFTTNHLTALLTFATSVAYLTLYTPLKKVHPICTFVGAFPGAMPPLLGWVAVRGCVEWQALVLFAIVFFWQFPHFHSIAWLYRDDYERAGIRMKPVVDRDGRSTARAVLLYSLALIPVSMAPSILGMAGLPYFVGAAAMSTVLFWFGLRLARLKMSPAEAVSKQRARHLLQATVFYLPLLFALMMLNGAPLK
jgi:protoheme IX farnesyltransferase